MPVANQAQAFVRILYVIIRLCNAVRSQGAIFTGQFLVGRCRSFFTAAGRAVKNLIPVLRPCFTPHHLAPAAFAMLVGQAFLITPVTVAIQLRDLFP